MSMAKGFGAMARKAVEEYNSTAFQFFVKSPRGRGEKPLIPEDIEEFQKVCQEGNVQYVIVHSSYLLNFGKPLNKAPWSLTDIKGDFEKLRRLGGSGKFAQGVVLHMGKAIEIERKEAIKNMVENVKHIVEIAEKTQLKLLLENTAGQGNELGFRFEEYGEIFHQVKDFSPLIRVCFDTAHSWGAGYDQTSEEAVKATFQEFDKNIGIQYIDVFHFNDAKKPLGARLDRHANIGTGMIGLPGLKALFQFANTHDIPCILETPGDENGEHLEEINAIRNFL